VAIVVDNDTRLVVQGLTGSEGRFHGLRNRAYGTNVVAGVTPGKGGQDVEGIPVFDTVADAVVCRLAAHHFADVLAAVKEMARVAGDRVVVCDNTFVSEWSEEADRVRDPSHVRNYGVAEWESFFELAGLRIVEQAHLDRPLEIEPWLARVECTGDDRARVYELLGDRVTDGSMPLPTLVVKGVHA